MSDYVKEYLEAFAIFSKSKALYDRPELDYGYIALYFEEAFSAEDHSRLIELGWEPTSSYLKEVGYYRQF